LRRRVRIAVLGSTRGTDLQAIIDAIESNKLQADIKLVISNKEDAYILERAKKHQLPALHISGKNKTREEFDAEVSRILKVEGVDLILLIGYMRILSGQFVRDWENRILNVHPSLLPEFAGGMDLNVHQAVIDAKAKRTGCTVHIVDEGVDSGHIVVQKACDVLPNDTADTLKAKVQELEGLALIEAIEQFARNEIQVPAFKK
jgi:phosphoribosylglycinamide formyltransferase-1